MSITLGVLFRIWPFSGTTVEDSTSSGVDDDSKVSGALSSVDKGGDGENQESGVFP